MACSPIAVANFFVQKSLETGIELTPMKLVKLVYLSHGWYLGLASQPLISEAVQAWKYGPVVNSVYHTFKKYGNEQILSQESDPENFQFSLPVIQDENIQAFLNKIWDVYSKYSGLQLSTLTHEQGSPWDKVWNYQGGKDRKAVIIPNALIQDYYRTKKDANRQSAQAN